MRNLAEIISNPHLSQITISSEKRRAGSGKVKLAGWEGWVVFDAIVPPWEHVSVISRKKDVSPTWHDLEQIKEIFWTDNEEAMQFFPRKSNVNIKRNIFHLWRNPKIEAIRENDGYRGE